MCCFLALRKVLLIGAFVHMFLGLLFLYYLVALITSLINLRANYSMGLLFMLYFCLFLPLGLVIFWGTLKKSRFLLRWAAGIFLILQIYGVTIQSAFAFSIHSWSPAISNAEQMKSKEGKENSATTTVAIQSILSLIYLFTIFFYLRELEPEEDETWNTSHRQVAYHPTQLQPIPITDLNAHRNFMMKC